MMPIIKKKCQACGNIVMVKRVMLTISKAGRTPAPQDCATCRSLGVEKAIEQRLMANRKGNKTEFIITKGSHQMVKEQAH